MRAAVTVAVSAVDIHVPEGVTEDEALLAVAQALGMDCALEKALKNPTTTMERARARRAFLSLQKDFRTVVSAAFEQMEKDAGMADIMAAEKGLSVRASGAVKELLDGTHRRSIATLNAQFRMAYERAFELGLRAGGAARGMSDGEAQIVSRQRLNENAYAGNFLTDIAHREGSMPYTKRIELYGNALEELYWQGYLYADLSAGRYVRWVMPYGGGFGGGTEREHCIDCARLAGNLKALEEHGIGPEEARKLGAGGRWGNGVYQAAELARMGVAPQSGKLSCTTHCHCTLEPAQRPKGKPRGKEMGPFRSLVPKHFTGTGRGKDGKVIVEREHEQERRKRYAGKAARTERRHLLRLRKHLPGLAGHDQKDHGRRYVSSWREMTRPNHIWRIGRLDPARLASWRRLGADNLDVVLTNRQLQEHIIGKHRNEGRERYLDDIPEVLFGPDTQIWVYRARQLPVGVGFQHLTFVGRGGSGELLEVAVRMQVEKNRHKHSVWTLHVSDVKRTARRTNKPDAVRVWP